MEDREASAVGSMSVELFGVDKKKEVHRGYICFKCGREGHVASDCREHPTDGERGPGFKGVICFKCGQGGHLANKCDKRTRGCFICGKDGHIAVECSEKYSSPAGITNPPNELSNSTPDSRRATEHEHWEHQAQKYRKTESPSKDITKEPSGNLGWELRDRETREHGRERERTRERKQSGWDLTDHDLYKR